MAQITGGGENTVVQIRAFLGLNENPDGETTLKIGEFSRMWNFRITQDKHLQKRPGSKLLFRVSTTNYWEKSTGDNAGESGGGAELLSRPDEGELPLEPPGWPEDTEVPPATFPEDSVVDPVTKEITHLFGAWHGNVAGKPRTLVNYDGTVYAVDLTGETGQCTQVGTCSPRQTSFFPFDGKVYLLDGEEYQVWDGGEGQFRKVVGYVPTVLTATTPGGAGTRLENVNRLNGYRRVEFSPDGEANTFKLPEKDIGEVVSVTLDGTAVEAAKYTSDAAAGTVKLRSAPPEGVNTLAVVYRKGDGARSEVAGMRYAELFNGSNDTRVFLYGDGSNKAIYSGVEYASGKPSAEYFPDLFEVAVGESNTPVTALVRHYSRLMAYKPGSAWVITAGSVTTESGRYTPAFYTAPVNRQFGNEAMGQVKLLENDPLTMDGGSVYQWRNVDGYVSNSENNAVRISDRVHATLRGFDVAHLRTYNVRREREFWFLYGNDAILYNYANDTWYFYKNLPFHDILEVEGQVYGFGNDGRVFHFSRACRWDEDTQYDPEKGADKVVRRGIDCYAETGAMDFGRDWQTKFSPMVFVAIRPESNARINVTVESNRRSGYPEKLVSANQATFEHVDFRHFSFITNRKPQARRLKLKVKKAAFYRIIYRVPLTSPNEKGEKRPDGTYEFPDGKPDTTATCTVIETDVRLRYAGVVK